MTPGITDSRYYGHKTTSRRCPPQRELTVIKKSVEYSCVTMALDKDKILAPDVNRTHDLPNTGRALYPLGHENSRKSIKGHLHNFLFCAKYLLTF